MTSRGWGGWGSMTGCIIHDVMMCNAGATPSTIQRSAAMDDMQLHGRRSTMYIVHVYCKLG